MTAKEMASKLGVEVLDRRRHYARAIILEAEETKGEWEPKIRVYILTSGRKTRWGQLYVSELKPNIYSAVPADEFQRNWEREMYCMTGSDSWRFENHRVLCTKELLNVFEALSDDWYKDETSAESKNRRRHGRTPNNKEPGVTDECFIEDVCNGLYDDELSVRLW